MIGALKSIFINLAAISLLSYTGTGCARAWVRPTDGAITSAGNMTITRAAHTATLLPNGKVLIAGGMQRSEAFSNTVELYDPTTGTFATTSNMTTKRAGHTATLLPTGKVLIAGGYDSRIVASARAWVYKPPSGNPPSQRIASRDKLQISPRIRDTRAIPLDE